MVLSLFIGPYILSYTKNKFVEKLGLNLAEIHFLQDCMNMCIFFSISVFPCTFLLPCRGLKKRQISHLRLSIQSTLVGQDGAMLMEKRYHLFTNTLVN